MIVRLRQTFGTWVVRCGLRIFFGPRGTYATVTIRREEVVGDE